MAESSRSELEASNEISWVEIPAMSALAALLRLTIHKSGVDKKPVTFCERAHIPRA